MSEAATTRAPRRTAGELLHPRPIAVTLAVLAFVLAGAVGAYGERHRGLTYASNEVLFIDQPLVIAASKDAGTIDKLARLRSQYAALLQTGVVADDIASRTGRSPGDVSSSVSALPAPTSLLIVLTAQDRDRAKAVALASASGDALIQYAATSQAQAGVPTAQRVVLSVVTPAHGAHTVTRGKRAVATVAVVLGLLGAALVYVVISLLGAGLRRR